MYFVNVSSFTALDSKKGYRACL